jgi:UDP-3-O-[3-hydroxymyristoyl] N-acetylglucosamine deacetylase/3-hydroxyacyl-[acyl-carrier-protein] dehydratase
MKQHTLKGSIHLDGKGLHTGLSIRVGLHPAETNSGYFFVRTDIEGAPQVKADPDAVFSTARGTSLKSGDVEVHTVEHLLSALFGLGIDNARIELDGPEVPILDGSALPFVEAIKRVGIETQSAERDVFVPQKPVHYEYPDSGAQISLYPSDSFELLTLVDFDSDVIGEQYAKLDDWSQYESAIAPSKTFVFVRDIEALMDQGLIKGGSLDNAIVIADEKVPESTLNRLSERLDRYEIKSTNKGILNQSDLRFANEPARHKLLDVVGDMALLGKYVQARIVAVKPGHKVNVAFTSLLKKEWQKCKKEEFCPEYDPSAPPVYTTQKIEQTLPHRFPFLMVDKIIELTENQVVGVKNITADQYFFQGHFPNNPVFPGVLQLEAMAQTGGILALSTVPDPDNWDTYFLKIDKVRFKRKVVPGDTLILKLKLLGPIRRGICFMHAKAFVAKELVSEGELTAQIIKRKS